MDQLRPIQFEMKKSSVDKPEQGDEFMREAQTFIDRNLALFSSISGDRSLRFKAGNSFMIDFEKKEITLEANDFRNMREKGESEAQILWSVCHELSHFRDLQENPEGMLGHFEYMWVRARELAPKVENIFVRRFGEVPKQFQTRIPFDKESGETVSGLEAMIYQKIHLFYNSLDDMYVNDVLAIRTPSFGRGGQYESEVGRLYRDFLFPTDGEKIGEPPELGRPVDYSKKPKSYQFTDSLLRRRMVGDQFVLLSPDVDQLLDGYLDPTAKRLGMTIRKTVETLTRYRNVAVRDPAERYKKLKQGIESHFVRLLMEDFENMPPPQPPSEKKGKGGKEGEGEGEGKEGEGKKTENKDQNNHTNSEVKPDPWMTTDDKPEPLDLQTIREYIKQKKEDDKKEEERKRRDRLNPEERLRLDQKDRDKAVCERHDADPKLAELYRELQQSVEPFKEQLANVFEDLMKTIDEKIRFFWVQGFRSGKLNIERFIYKYGAEIASEQYHLIPFDSLDVYDQKDLISRISILPNRFRFRLVGDGSGSMHGERIVALQQLTVLFEEAFASLEANMNQRFRLKEPVVCDTEVRMFGDVGRSVVVKPLMHGARDMESEMVSRWQALGQINSDYGMTYDAEAFDHISQSISTEDLEDIQKGRLVEFVVEVTDGGSQTAQETRDAVHQLSEKGIITRGLQIAEPTDEERNIFDSVWGTDGAHVADVSKVAGAIASMIENEIKKISTKIQHYEVDDNEQE